MFKFILFVGYIATAISAQTQLVRFFTRADRVIGV